MTIAQKGDMPANLSSRLAKSAALDAMHKMVQKIVHYVPKESIKIARVKEIVKSVPILSLAQYLREAHTAVPIAFALMANIIDLELDAHIVSRVFLVQQVWKPQHRRKASTLRSWRIAPRITTSFLV